MDIENSDDEEEYPVNPRFRTLLENDYIQNFLQRHGMTTYGRIPLRKEELEQRLRQIDDQTSVDLIAQSLVEKALDIKRPFSKSKKHVPLPDTEEITDQNPHVALYDNSCAITMIYCGSKPFQNDILYTFKIQSDEIVVMQYQTNASSIVVYKSFLKPNDEFTFKSHRLLDTPFTVAIYINGVIDSRIATCCEHGYSKQHRLRSRRSAFRLSSINGGIPCYTCQANDLANSSASDDDDFQSELISIVNLNQAVPSFSFPTASARSEPSMAVSSTRKDKIKLSHFKSNETDISSEISEKQSTTTDMSLTRASVKLSTDKVIKTVNQIIIQTDGSNSKLDADESIRMKIASEDEEGGQSTSVANHEMLQLLSKYLSLLLPPSKPQMSDNNTPIYLIRASQVIEFKPTTSSTPSNCENVETFVLVWLDATIDMNEDTIISQTKLRSIVNSLFTFYTIDEAIHFIENVNEEKVFLIVSDSFGCTLIERTEINDLPQLDSIYIFSQDQSKHKSLMEREHKVRGIFTDIDLLCERLKKDIEQTSNDLLPISVAPGEFSFAKSMMHKKKQEKQVAFLRAQLHRELLLTMEYPDDARLDLVEFCTHIYADNQTERELIEELRDEYHADKAVWWYEKYSFLRKMLNTALIRQDIPMLYKFHFFIKDLHMQLVQLHSLYKTSLESRTFTVYRGLGMPMKIFDETIRQEVNNLLAFDTFLAASLNREIAVSFARNKSNNDDESIVFEIEIDTDKLERPFADISCFSKDEILFSIGTVFRIDHVSKEKPSDGIWIVHLSSISENDQQLKTETKQTQLTLLNFFKRVWQAQIKRGDRRQIATSYLNMASIYYKQSQYQKSLELYQKALENLLSLPSPDRLTIATYRSHIAMVHIALGQLDEALKFYEEVFNIRIKCCETNDSLLIDTLHTIGDIYRRKKEFNKALKQYQKALDLQPISLKHNPSSIAATHINIALVYHQQNKFDRALEHFSQALNYQRQYLSEYHPILAFSYNNIGAMYYRLKKFELALENQLMALKIEERSLPKTLAGTYSNIATTYEQLKNYDQAINYVRKSVNQLKLHVPEDDYHLQTKQAYLNRLVIDKNASQNK